MAVPLRLLVVDDNALDAELECAALRDGGFEPSFHLVATREDYLQALDENDFDLVLSDYSLPAFDGLTALRLFLARELDKPFVLVSGTIGEEVAIESLRAGATDYVLKTRLERLAPVVKRALDEKEELRRRKRAEKALRRSERNLRSLIDNAPYGIFRAELSGRFVLVNPALLKILGYTSEAELRAVALRDVFLNGEEAGQLTGFAERGEAFSGLEFAWKRKDAKPITVRLSGRPVRKEQDIAVEVIAEDITERRALQEQLLQAQKMEAVGRLAGGVAHDFNNLLTVIIGYAELLRDRLADRKDDRHYAEGVWQAAKKATLVTQQLLAFSRKQVVTPRVIDLNKALEDVGKLLPRLIGEDIHISFQLAPDAGKIKIDPGQVEQVIINLAVNARDAMPRGGQLTFETGNVRLTAEDCRRLHDVGPGNYLRFAVTDNGLGMDAATQSRIFEPFFTTKEKGEGTGLGLATVYGIVKQSAGDIALHSAPGNGARFEIFFPRVDLAVDSEASQSVTHTPPGSETILLVEDEESVRALVRQVLKRKGYNVLEAEHVSQALQICREHGGTIDLVVTDVVMPEMSGRDLATQLTALRPQMKVLYMSGYTDDATLRRGILPRGTSFLQKPFTPEVLVRAIHDVIHGGAGHAAVTF
jgi:PAS domain S-box-containing protein